MGIHTSAYRFDYKIKIVYIYIYAFKYLFSIYMYKYIFIFNIFAYSYVYILYFYIYMYLQVFVAMSCFHTVTHNILYCHGAPSLHSGGSLVTAVGLSVLPRVLSRVRTLRRVWFKGVDAYFQGEGINIQISCCHTFYTVSSTVTRRSIYRWVDLSSLL